MLQHFSSVGSKTCATCPYYQGRNDGTDKGWCGLFDVFARENHVVTQDCINTITDEQAAAQEELNEYIETQAEAIAPEQQPVAAVTTPDLIEVDSDYDPVFGIMYRVWFSYHLLGTFYQDMSGKWIAQPCNSNFRPQLNTPEQAQLVIIANYGCLATDLLAA